MLPCQVTLNENSKYNLTPIFHIMKILMMHERGIFLAVFVRRPLPKETGNMMWNLLSPLNWFHYGTSNYKSTIQEKRGKAGRGWRCGLFISQERRMFHSLSPERLIACGVAAPEMKLTISTGMHWHIIYYILIVVFCEIWARSCSFIISVLICLLFNSKSSKRIAKGLIVLLKPCHRVPKPVNHI